LCSENCEHRFRRKSRGFLLTSEVDTFHCVADSIYHRYTQYLIRRRPLILKAVASKCGEEIKQKLKSLINTHKVLDMSKELAFLFYFRKSTFHPYGHPVLFLPCAAEYGADPVLVWFLSLFSTSLCDDSHSHSQLPFI
jgi:hypothetical protein